MSTFEFKHFSIKQEVAAVKVGTDAMMLGCLPEIGNAQKVLEIGTGTGVISLILSQRFPEVNIDALEIHPETAQEAILNVKLSPFKERIKVYQNDFLLFQSNKRYDVIIANPPYFENGLLPEEEKLKIAKHIEYEQLSSWFEHISELLKDTGKCWLILPASSLNDWIQLANNVRLHLVEQIDLYAKPTVCKRLIVSFSKIPRLLVHTVFTIRNEDGNYTKEYISRTKDFHNRIPIR